MAKTAVQVEIPAGMSAEDLNKLFGTFLKQRVSGKARDKAKASAIKKLIAAHEEEYEKFLEAGMPKA